MAIEIRSANADELPDVLRILTTSLAQPLEDFAALQPDFTLVAFDDGRPASVHGSWPLTMRFNGKAVPISGVTTVSTDSIDRQRGYLRKLITRHFEELHEAGERPLAVLFASQAAIYQRYGYAVVSTQYQYDIEPRFIQFNEALETPGRLRHVDPDPDKDFGTLVGLYREYREARTGEVHRGKPMWDAGILAPPAKGETRSVLVYEEDGELQGYAIYRTGPGNAPWPEPNHVCEIDDIVWLTPQAYRAFWQNFATMQLVNKVSWHNVSPDDPLPHLLLEPRMLRRRSRDQLLARVVDVEGSFRGRGYEESERLTFTLEDDVCPWNTGTWQIHTGPDDAEVTRLSEGTDGAAADVSLRPGTLAMLLFGQITASEAARYGKLTVHNASALPTWDKTLRTKFAPFTADHW
ncbi:MAG: GNAT family N-acetyltransferase [Chloroflexi bacterium]|nr:GNAT family N-acetyltransferase [Chloroflexota bacterium]MDA1146004.1 GNAT family N-acetyltransferase [Chloroflexota bacterium]